MEKRKTRIITLWILTIVGLLTHSSLDLLPLFWGKSVAVMEGEVPVAMALMTTCFTFTLPFIGLMFVLYGKKRCACLASLIVAILVMVFNIGHMIELTMEFDVVQLFIMPLTAIAAILLVIDLWKSQCELKK